MTSSGRPVSSRSAAIRGPRRQGRPVRRAAGARRNRAPAPRPDPALRVVDDPQRRVPLGALGEQVQNGQADQEPIGRHPRLQSQRGCDGVALCQRDGRGTRARSRTENGCAASDVVAEDGQIYDSDRVMFMPACLSELQRATSDGVPVDGYFHWGAQDNFEWIYGYGNRFGLIYVDFDTLERTPKLSAHWFREAAARDTVV